jgi:hypothetical protein
MSTALTDADRANGEARKLDALNVLAEHRGLYVLRGRRALLTALLAVGEATADYVRAAVELPLGIGPRCYGLVPGALAKAGTICRVGFVPTCRPDAHARPVSVWTLADRAAAVRWLVDHPDRPDEDQAAPAVQGMLFDPFQKTATPTGTAAGAA